MVDAFFSLFELFEFFIWNSSFLYMNSTCLFSLTFWCGDAGSPLFSQLRQKPGFQELVDTKIQLLEGDLDRDGFGLGEVRLGM